MLDSTAQFNEHQIGVLESSALSADYALSMGVRAAHSAGDLAFLGDQYPLEWWSKNLPGMLFPLTQAGHTEWQFRPDNPGEGPKYLFRSKKDGGKYTPWVLREPTADGFVLVVEGTKQALAVARYSDTKHGVIGIGGCDSFRENDLPAEVLSLARRRRAIMFFDADVRSNYRVHSAALKLQQALKYEGATDVGIVDLGHLVSSKMPKPGIDDVLSNRNDRDHYLATAIGLAKEYRPTKAETNALRKIWSTKQEHKKQEHGVFRPPGEAAPNARAYLSATGDSLGRPLVRWWREQWAYYDIQRGHWVVDADKDALTARLFRFFESAWTTHEGTLVPWNPTPASVAGVEAAVRSFSRVDSRRDSPCWLNTDGSYRPPARECLVFTNGFLHLPTMGWHSPDPDLFATQGTPFAYDPAATIVGTRWERFLKEVFPDDPHSTLRLQQIMGYLISGRVDLEKLFLFVGSPRAGKGTVGRVLEGILGDSATGTSIDGLSGGTFALEGLLNHKLCVVGDARTGTRNISAAVERLLSISGGDSVRVDRKFRSTISGQLPVNFLIMSNEDLIMEEASGALASRFEVMEFRTSFLGREDRHLKDELTHELPAILRWALDGLAPLDAADGRFTASERVLEMQAEMRRAGSPHIRFAEECLDLNPTGWVPVRTLYEAWSLWCLRNGVPPGNDVHFCRGLVAAYRGAVVRSRRGVPRAYGYSGVTMKG